MLGQGADTGGRRADGRLGQCVQGVTQHVLAVARGAELGKDDQVSALLGGTTHHLLDLCQVGLLVTHHAVVLREGDRHRPAHASSANLRLPAAFTWTRVALPGK